MKIKETQLKKLINKVIGEERVGFPSKNNRSHQLTRSEEKKYPERIPGEAKFVEWDDETDMWGIFGEKSGHCYALYCDKEQAENKLGIKGRERLGDFSESKKQSLKQIFKEAIDPPEEPVVSETDVSELVLFIENDGQLYQSQTTPIRKNLIKKMVKGVYDHKLAIKLWSYLVEAGAKKYCKEFCGPAPDIKWFEVFDVETRGAAAKELADTFLSDIRSGEIKPEDYDIKGEIPKSILDIK